MINSNGFLTDGFIIRRLVQGKTFERCSITNENEYRLYSLDRFRLKSKCVPAHERKTQVFFLLLLYHVDAYSPRRV